MKSCKETVRTHQQLTLMKRNSYKPSLSNMVRVQKILRYVTHNLHLSDLNIMTMITGLVLIIIIIIFAIAINKNLTRPEFDLMAIYVGFQHARQ